MKAEPGGGRAAGRRRSGDVQLRADFLRLKAAVYDTNTELYASPALLETIRALFQRSRSVGLIHIEIDPLCRVEAVYGWQVLDGILRAVSGVLREIGPELLPADAVIGQAGICADRFVVVLPLARSDQTTGEGPLMDICMGLEQRLIGRFSGPDFRSMTPRPVFSIGCTTIVEHPFFRLERQIYRGIDEARDMGLKGDSRQRTRQHVELKRIIRDQTIEILFQPSLELVGERIIGYEAFTRGPRDTVFETPSTLFEYSREAGMASELDLICQRAALRQARKLSTGDKLFLNALPDSLLDPGFREGLLADLPEGFPIGREDIVLEFADRHSVGDFAAFESEVTGLRSLGFRMSIDDVGKASTSLESLAEVHPDFIKVDMSLIRNIHNNLIKQDLLRSVCETARGIDAQVIAEGIETREELEAVLRCGARYGQGYLFFRPSKDLPAGRTAVERGGM